MQQSCAEEWLRVALWITLSLLIVGSVLILTAVRW
jgi:hypothetical protein